jgi:hypothetical protein
MDGVIFPFAITDVVTNTVPISEYYWADKVQGTRESELKWRIKENIVDTLISFIWLRF